MTTEKPLAINLLAIIFSNVPSVNDHLQTIVLVLSIIVSSIHIYRSYKK